LLKHVLLQRLILITERLRIDLQETGQKLMWQSTRKLLPKSRCTAGNALCFAPEDRMTTFARPNSVQTVLVYWLNIVGQAADETGILNMSGLQPMAQPVGEKV